MAGFAAVLSAFSLGSGDARDPYVGVACHQPNVTTCGRVGIAVWLARRHAIRVYATLAGVQVRLTPPEAVGGFWVGFVRLPLRKMGLPTSWAGEPPVRLALAIRIHYPSGWRSDTLRLYLHSGWG